MSLNGVPASFHFCVYSAPKLTEETIRKLISLGINPNTVSSEAQAQALIAQIEKTQAVKEPTNESSSKNTLTSEKDLEKKNDNLNKLLFKL